MQLRLSYSRSSITNLWRQFRLLRWFIPSVLVALVVGYEIGPARWILDNLGVHYHIMAEILLFGTVGPVLVFFVLDLHAKWQDERDTADYQAQLLSQAKQNVEKSRRLNDESLQLLFATSLLIGKLKSDQTSLPPDLAAHLEATEQALDQTRQRLQDHLQEGSLDQA